MNNRWQRRLWASVGLPKGYRGAAGPLLAALGVDPDELREALLAELREMVPSAAPQGRHTHGGFRLRRE